MTNMLREWVPQSKLNSFVRLWLKLMRIYFRVESEGLAEIPKKGGVLLISNHSGFAGADALILAHVIKRATKRRPRILVHRAFFDFSPALRQLSENFGLKKATIAEGVASLKRGRMVMLFPEGETGNFKSSLRSYRLQKFHTGFLRMALMANVPVVPCIVLGAEESHLNVGNINLGTFIKGLRIPLPLNWVPLPAKWRILVLPPLGLECFEGLDPTDREGLERAAAKIRAQIQKEIRLEIRRRPYVYFRKSAGLRKKLIKTAKKILT